MTDHIYAHEHPESDRVRGGGFTVWFTGLSGSGKSTLANAMEVELHGRGMRTCLLDGDNVRQGLNRDLGFTEADRVENIRRVGEVARLMMDAGLIVLAAFISPFRRDREMVRERIGARDFLEVYLATPLEICEQRDPKGLYRQARAGQLAQLIVHRLQQPLGRVCVAALHRVQREGHLVRARGVGRGRIFCRR